MGHSLMRWHEFAEYKFFDAAAAQKILDKNPKQVANDYPAERVAYHLNSIMLVSISCQFKAIKTKPELREIHDLALAALAYGDMARSWAEQGIMIPQMNTELQNQLSELCVETSEAVLPKKIKKSGAWAVYFYPRVIGLYRAVFEDEPVSTGLSDETKIPENGCADLLFKVLERVNKQQAELEFPRALRWDVLSKKSLLNNISTYKSKRNSSHPGKSEGQTEPDSYMWRNFVDLYSVSR